jgi:hypothetical protein
LAHGGRRSDFCFGSKAEIQTETLAAPKPWNQTDAAAFADASRYGNLGSAILNDDDDDF